MKIFNHTSLFTLILGLSALLWMGQAPSANAASLTWDGGGADANWSTCANWSSNACPTASDSVAFNTTSVKNATLDSSFGGTIRGLSISSGYTGTLTQSRPLTINGNYSQATGTFTGGSANIDINGTFTLSGGSFTSTSETLSVSGAWTHSTGTFVHNNGSIELDGSTSTLNLPGASTVNFYNFRVKKNNGVILTVSSGDTVIVNGTLTLSEGRWNTGTIQAMDAVDIASTWDGNGTGILNISSVEENISIPAALPSNVTRNIILNGADTILTGTGSGTIEFSALTLNNGSLNLDAYNSTYSGTFTLNSGSFHGGSGTIDFNGVVNLNGGTFTATSGTLSAAKAWTRRAEASFIHNGGTVEWDGAGVTIDVPSSESFYNLHVNSTGTKTIASNDTWTVLGDLTFTNGLLSGSTASIELKGNLNMGANADAVNVPISLSGIGAQVLSTVVNNLDGDLTLNKLSGTVELSQPLVLNGSGQDLKIQNGTLILNGNDLSVNGSSATFVIQNMGVLELNGDETLTFNSNNPSLQAGSIVRYKGEEGSYVLKNYSYQNLEISGGQDSIFSLPANKTIAQNLTISAGILSQNSFNLSVTGIFSNDGTLSFLGNEIFTGTMDTNSGTVEYSGDGDENAESFTMMDFGAGSDFFNLKINDQNTISDVFVLGATLNLENGLEVSAGEFKQNNFSIHSPTLNVNGGIFTGGEANMVISGDLTLSSGTLTAPGTNLTVYQNWNRSGGTFVHNNGTVSFAATSPSIISDNNSFLNFNVIDPGKLLIFTADTTQTVSGNLTLTGSPEMPIMLQSTESSEHWYLVSNGSQNVSYIDVSDSDASGGNRIQQVDSLNSGNNINWDFNSAPVVDSVYAQQSTDGTGLIIIDYTLSDEDEDTVEIEVEYSLDGGDTWANPTLSGDTSLAADDMPTAASLTWNAALDVPGTDTSRAKIRITPNDGSESGAAQVSNDFTVDLLAPGIPLNFNHGDFSDNHINLTWLPLSDSNFNHYEIRQGESEASTALDSSSGQSWDETDDPALSLASTDTAHLSGQDPRWKYFKIFAIDDFGNVSSSAVIFIAARFTSGSSVNTPTTTTTTTATPDFTTTEATPQEETSTVTEISESVSIDLESFWNNFGHPVPAHWSSGYLKHLQTEEKVAASASTTPTLLNILVEIFVEPNGVINRGESLEFLMTLSSYEVSGVILSSEEESIFTDVPSNYERAKVIDYAYQQGLINGYPDQTFRPTQTISRAEALKMVAHFFDQDLDTSLRGKELLSSYELKENPFTDVNLEEWYAPYVIYAYTQGVIKGYQDGMFKPGNAVSYAEFLKIGTLFQNIDAAITLAAELEM